VIAWIAHLYTASGAVFAFLAARAIIEHDYRTAFFWLGVQIVVDATDGVLARALRVDVRTPGFNGAKLDDIVDYLTYVFVPALFVWRAVLVPDAWALWVAGAMLLSSAYGFNRADAKTTDYFFTGFPSYWNLVVFYLHIGQSPSTLNALILVALAALVFVPIRYVYPSRTPVLRWQTNVLGAIWGALLAWMLWQYPAISRPVFLVSLLYPAYYFALSLFLTWKRRAV
jgi:phosphatidylcholine synthase